MTTKLAPAAAKLFMAAFSIQARIRMMVEARSGKTTDKTHYVNFRRSINPRRCWTCVIPPGAGRRRPTGCRESAKSTWLRWGNRRQFGPFFRLRWDGSDTQADVVQLRGRRSGRVQGLQNRRGGGNVGRQPTRNCHRSRPVARGIGADRTPLKQGLHPRQAFAKTGHIRADGLSLVFHTL